MKKWKKDIIPKLQENKFISYSQEALLHEEIPLDFEELMEMEYKYIIKYFQASQRFKFDQNLL